MENKPAKQTGKETTAISEDAVVKEISGVESYEGHMVHTDTLKNLDVFYEVAEEYGFSAENVISHLVNWNGMQILTRDFLESLCRDHELDPEQFDISDDTTKNYDPAVEIMCDTLDMSTDDAIKTLAGWNGAQIFTAAFMDNLFRVELELESD